MKDIRVLDTKRGLIYLKRLEPTGLGVSGSVLAQMLSWLPLPQPPTPSPNPLGLPTLHHKPAIWPSWVQFAQVDPPLFSLFLCPSLSSSYVGACHHMWHIWEGVGDWPCHKSAHREGDPVFPDFREGPWSLTPSSPWALPSILTFPPLGLQIGLPSLPLQGGSLLCIIPRPSSKPTSAPAMCWPPGEAGRAGTPWAVAVISRLLSMMRGGAHGMRGDRVEDQHRTAHGRRKRMA